MLLAVLPLLIPLAHARPADPSWIDGIYDDADLDSVVALATSSAAVTEPFPLDDAASVALAILFLRPLEEWSRTSWASPSTHARPPP